MVDFEYAKSLVGKRVRYTRIYRDNTLMLVEGVVESGQIDIALHSPVVMILNIGDHEGIEYGLAEDLSHDSPFLREFYSQGYTEILEEIADKVLL